MEQSYRVEEGTGGCPWVGASEGEALAAAWTSLEEACFQGASLQIGQKNINDGFDKYMYHNYFMDIIGGVIPEGICTKQTEKCNIMIDMKNIAIISWSSLEACFQETF